MLLANPFSTDVIHNSAKPHMKHAAKVQLSKHLVAQRGLRLKLLVFRLYPCWPFASYNGKQFLVCTLYTTHNKAPTKLE